MKKISKEQLVKIAKSRPWFVQGFNGLPLYLHNVAANTGWMIKEVCGTSYTHFFLSIHESRAKWGYDEEDMANVGHGYYKKIKKISQLKNLEAKHKARYFKARKLTGNIKNDDLQKLSFKDLVSVAQKLSNELTSSVGIAHSQEGISFVSEMKLKHMLDKRNLNTSENFQLLSSPIKPSFLSEAQILLWHIGHSAGSKRGKLIKKFQKEFSWLDNSYVRGKTFTREGVLEKTKHQKYLPSITELRKTNSAKQRLMKELQLTPEERFVIQTIEIVTKWQDNRKKFIMQAIGKFEPAVIELAKRLNMETDEFKYICPKELTYNNLTSKKFLAELKSRWPGGIFYSLEHGVLVYSSSEGKYIEKQIAKTQDQGITKLKGMVACKGIVKGYVKICRSIHDIIKVEKGEILVASMTRPEFLPAMQKAAGFITDEGGITSHAAIVSREMNKPCIIGTKIATQVFKDGDLVEVDANKGIVRKIQ